MAAEHSPNDLIYWLRRCRSDGARPSFALSPRRCLVVEICHLRRSFHTTSIDVDGFHRQKICDELVCRRMGMHDNSRSVATYDVTTSPPVLQSMRDERHALQGPVSLWRSPVEQWSAGATVAPTMMPLSARSDAYAVSGISRIWGLSATRNRSRVARTISQAARRRTQRR
jgi:hypothetical protein